VKRIVILGSTGSVGKSAIEIIERNTSDFDVVGLAGGSNFEELSIQLRKFPSAGFTMKDSNSMSKLMKSGDSLEGRDFGVGTEAIGELIKGAKPDMVLNALVGIAGMLPTITAIEMGCPVALANKETLVAGGELVSRMVPDMTSMLIPVDSEHFSISRCLRGNENDTAGIVLTASGGPFYGRELNSLENVSIEEVLEHPTWEMGRKVTVDSAHLLNKGLEVIEAKWLFGFPYDAIDVLVHPQSIVHCLIRMLDGSFLAHMGPADMRLPIMNALYFPEIREFPWKSIGLAELGQLEFRTLSMNRFPAFRLAMEAAEAGGTAPTVLNAADEVAIEAFLSGRIGFLRIIDWIEDALAKHDVKEIESVEDVLEADLWTRRFLYEHYSEARVQ